jgi:hypothetical protein
MSTRATPVHLTGCDQGDLRSLFSSMTGDDTSSRRPPVRPIYDRWLDKYRSAN